MIGRVAASGWVSSSAVACSGSGAGSGVGNGDCEGAASSAATTAVVRVGGASRVISGIADGGSNAGSCTSIPGVETLDDAWAEEEEDRGGAYRRTYYEQGSQKKRTKERH